MKTFWKFTQLRPKDTNEYLIRKFRNGAVHVPYYIPYFQCSECHIWAYPSFFPFVCPDGLKKHPYIMKLSTVGIREYKKISTVIQKEFKKNNINSQRWMIDPVLGFEPGTAFADRILEIPCHPSFSFYWQNVQDDAVVTEKVKKVFENEGFSGITFTKANVDYIGRFDIKKTVPSWDQLISWDVDGCVLGSPKEIPPEQSIDQFGVFYAMCIHVNTPYDDDDDLYPRCKTCGKVLRPFNPNRREYLPQKTIPQLDFFNSPHVNGIIITNRVRQVIEKNCFTNYHIEKIDVE